MRPLSWWPSNRSFSARSWPIWTVFSNMDATVLSVVAGATMARLGSDFGVSRVVRVMPNTPAQIGRGMSVWTATDTVDEAGRNKVQVILSALGAEEYVIHENELDMATALSGTGPAYVFLFMEALVDAGRSHGVSRDGLPRSWSSRPCSAPPSSPRASPIIWPS